MDEMRNEYDFSNAKRNPYVNRVKKQITINLDDRVISYFKKEAKETGIPYQNLINLYLLDCATGNKKLKISWE